MATIQEKDKGSIIFIEKENFQKYIFQFITDGNVKKLLDTMEYDTRDFESGFISGLAWASLLTSQVRSWELEIVPKGEEETDEDTTD